VQRGRGGPGRGHRGKLARYGSARQMRLCGRDSIPTRPSAGSRAGWVSTSSSRTSSPPPTVTAPSVVEVRLDCSYNLFLLGPDPLASSNELTIFDSRAIAERYAEVYGYDAERINVCERALDEGKSRYGEGSLAGWPPYGRESRWLYRWSSYYFCAQAILGDYKGAAHRLLVGSATVREAARDYSHETVRQGLWRPGFDGCVPGCRLGLGLRAQT
jgi:hypothetical protein